MNFTTLTASHLAQLTQIVGMDNLTTAQAVLNLHASDESHHTGHDPDVVIWPQTAQQVADILCFANDHRIPLRPGE